MMLVRRLAVLAALFAAAAVWSGSALAAAPTNSELPAIAGSAREDWRLEADTGTWANSPTVYSYQWRQCDVTCSDIPGATAPVYVAGPNDVGTKLAVAVRATNADGSTTATSVETAPITPTFRLFTTGGHFIVHYQSDPRTPDAITETMAGDVGAFAERAYASELADGYPAPLADGALGNRPGDSGSYIDIYVDALGGGMLGYAEPDAWTSPAEGYIVVDGADPTYGLDQHTIAHELFHLIQFGIWLPSQVSDYWLLEGSAEWMGYRVDGFSYGPAATEYTLGDWAMVLDCRDPLLTYKCDLSGDYKNNGYSRWPFFEYVVERWGDGFVKNVFAQGAAGSGTATAALANAVSAKGAALPDVFTDWAVANMTGDYKVEKLQTLAAPAYGTPVAAGTLTSLNRLTKPGNPKITSGAIPAVTVPVNHLSARYVEIDRGDPNAPDAPCYAATLTLRVTIPSGTGAHPYFWWSEKNPDGTNKEKAQMFAIGDGVATITVPWDTCQWAGTKGYVALANPSTTRDAADFTVSGTLTVDRTTQASPKSPPQPVKQHGPTVDTSGSTAVPQISVFGPQVFRIAAGAKLLRVVVSSDGPGQLRGALGSLKLGTKTLRAGGNDLRFTLPKTVKRTTKSTRAAKSDPNVLTLTPLSIGGAAGQPVTRRVVLLAPAAKVAAGILR